MARINTYDLDQAITVDDLILGSSHEGVFNGNVIYKTRNYRLSDLAQFFRQYDFSNDISLLSIQQDLTALTTRVTTLENAGYLTEHPDITAASSVDNSGQFFIQDITLDSNGHILSITSAESSGGGGTTDLTSFSVTTSAAGTPSLVYNNTSGVFTYTPPDLSSYLTSVAFSDITSTPTTLAGYGITDAFDGAYSSLTGTPSVYTTTQVNNIFSGTTTIVGYNRTDWDNAYDNSITSMTVTGTSTKTITLNQQDGGTITATFTDISETGQGNITDTNDFVTSGSFSNGTLTLQIQNQSNVTVTGFDSRYYTETEVDNLITNFISLSSISVGANAQPSGNGGIAYNNTSGVFTYTPPDFSGSYLPTTGGTLTGDLILASGADLTLQGGDVSITGNLSLSGTITGSSFTGDLRGDLYSITGSTAATKVLETGAGSSPDTYYIGDLRNNQTDIVFDTSLTMFRKDVKIGDYDNSLGGGAENLDLYLGATSSIFFGTGTAQKELSATIISDFNFAVFSTITGVSLPGGVLTLRTKGADENEPGYSNYTVDLQTYFDARYVELAGDTMTGNLSFSLESIGVVGNIFNTNGTKILENGSNTQTAYLVGNVAGDIVSSDTTTVIYDSSAGKFYKDLIMHKDSNVEYDIKLGETATIYFGEGTPQEQTVTGTQISQWDAANEKHITNMEFQEGLNTDAGKFELYLTAEDSNQNRTTDWLIEEGSYMNMSITERVSNSGQGAINIALDYSSLISNLDGIYSRIAATVTNITVNGQDSMAGAVDFANGTSINAVKDGSTQQVTFNFVKGTGANEYLQEGDIPRTNWNTAYNSNITDLSFGNSSTSGRIDLNLITRDGSTADINVADILRQGQGITLGADPTGFLTVSVDTSSIATQSYVNSQITGNSVTGVSIQEGSTVTNLGGGDIRFVAAGDISLSATTGTNPKQIEINVNSSLIERTDLSATNSSTLSTNGSLSYDNSSGVFTYSPVDLSSYANLSDFQIVTTGAGNAALAYNVVGSTGRFTYTPPDLSGFITGISEINIAQVRGQNAVNFNSSGERVAEGIAYYTGTGTNITAVGLDTPSSSTLSTFNFSTGQLNINHNSNKWSQLPPSSNTSNGSTIFVIEWSATDSGPGNITWGSIKIGNSYEGLVSFQSLSSSGKSVIDGDNIITGSIRSSNFSAGTDGFSNAGSKIDLTNGSIQAKEFRVDSSGNAKFKGKLDVADGTFTVDSTQKIVTTENVTIDGQTISLTSSSQANIGEINFIQQGAGEVASIQNFSGSNITNPEFRIQTTTNGGPIKIYGYDTNSNAGDFYESARMASDRDLSIQADSTLIGGTLTYHITATLNSSGASESAELLRLDTYSGAPNKSLIIEVIGSCDTHAVQAIFGARSNNSGSWSITRRIHQGDTGNFRINQMTGGFGQTLPSIEMRNLTASSSLPANAVIRVSGSREIMNYDDLEQILNFANVSRDTYSVATT